MYRLTATRKLNVNPDDLPNLKYSDGQPCEDSSMNITIENDHALKEIVTGLIHDGYTVTIKPGIWYRDTRDEEVSGSGSSVMAQLRQGRIHVTGPNSMPAVTSDMSTPVPTDSAPGRF